RSTFASGLANVGSLVFDGTGNLFAGAGGDFESNTAKIYKFARNGERSLFASGLISPSGLAFDSAGNLFVVDAGDSLAGVGCAIYKYSSSGARSVFLSTSYLVGNSIGPFCLALDRANNVFVSDWVYGRVYKFTPAAGRSTFASGFSFAPTLAFDSAGNLFA